MEVLKTFFIDNFSNFIWIAVFIMCLLPVFEGRLAFPFAINEKLLGNNAMPIFLAMLTCFLASVFLTLFLLTFFKSFKKFLKKFKTFKKIFEKIDSLIYKKSEKIKEKNNKYFYLALFVLTPLPLTGIWSASLIASFLNLDFKKSLFSIITGNLLCLILIFILNLFFKDFTLILLIISFVLTILVLLFSKLKKPSFKINFIND
ncbi:MAG: hypothetical protein E7359_03950 [Clostridiales bacterium]|nr:hypothetical protein [Clostridiales bacterium]